MTNYTKTLKLSFLILLFIVVSLIWLFVLSLNERMIYTIQFTNESKIKEIIEEIHINPRKDSYIINGRMLVEEEKEINMSIILENDGTFYKIPTKIMYDDETNSFSHFEGLIINDKKVSIDIIGILKSTFD